MRNFDCVLLAGLVNHVHASNVSVNQSDEGALETHCDLQTAHRKSAKHSGQVAESVSAHAG